MYQGNHFWHSLQLLKRRPLPVTLWSMETWYVYKTLVASWPSCTVIAYSYHPSFSLGNLRCWIFSSLCPESVGWRGETGSRLNLPLFWMKACEIHWLPLRVIIFINVTQSYIHLITNSDSPLCTYHLPVCYSIRVLWE